MKENLIYLRCMRCHGTGRVASQVTFIEGSVTRKTIKVCNSCFGSGEKIFNRDSAIENFCK